jgi:hypothetical protein
MFAVSKMAPISLTGVDARNYPGLQKAVCHESGHHPMMILTFRNCWFTLRLRFRFGRIFHTPAASPSMPNRFLGNGL